jgi:hypothetical protein
LFEKCCTHSVDQKSLKKIRNFEEKIPLGKYRCRQKDNIKMVIKIIRSELDSLPRNKNVITNVYVT